MKAQHKRGLFWSVMGLLLVAGLMMAFWPRALVVDIAEIGSGPLASTVTEEGITRVKDIYTLSSPVDGRLQRIEAEAGDPVVAGETVIAQIEPIDPSFLDPRSEAQAQASVRAAESAEGLAKAEVEQAQAELDFAVTELERARQLISESTISRRELDNAERLYRTRKAALATALAALQVRSFELERAKALLLSPRDTQAQHGVCECIPIRAPVDGRVLRKIQESEGVVSAGAPLVEIGNPEQLEIVADLLSTDAVKVEAGQDVEISGWGGEGPLQGRVRIVEPFGFTKISALGIEEQRVNVIIDFTSDTRDWQRLAHGYQVEVHVILWRSKSVLSVPLTALFRSGRDWAVYVVEDGRAVLRTLKLGHRSAVAAEVLDGLTAGDRVILHPSNQVDDGIRVAPRD